MKRWLAIVGIGEDGLRGLSGAARGVVENAEVVVGGQRHLAMCESSTAKKISWPSPFSALVSTLLAHRGDRVCVLATGDPFCYGVGSTLVREIAIDEMWVYPSPSAFALARARLGWSAQDISELSVHGRAFANIELAIQPEHRFLVLSHDETTPRAIAAKLVERGFGPSTVTVLEHLGGDAERIRAQAAGAFSLDDIAPFNTVAVHCHAAPDASIRSTVPGLADDAFRSDGQLTKRMVRAVTVSALQPLPGQLLWDVGAGCGSVAIEWLRAAPGTHAIAIESRADRAELIRVNAASLGVPGLSIHCATAPEVLRSLPPPDAVFIGGGVTVDGVLDECMQALRPGGRLVVNAVSLEGGAALVDAHRQWAGELATIATAHARPTGGFMGFVPARPVTQWVYSKALP
ncbi:MAG: precorrin-6y C5,15-methyltransferase (decarboxylating) subunit CbiE [Pseudomonadota bacterium]